jgi:hypothetical protein
MAKTIIQCEGCGELILRPFDEHGVNRCPACGRMMSLNVVDLSDRPDILRRLRAVQQEPPLKPKATKT